MLNETQVNSSEKMWHEQQGVMVTLAGMLLQRAMVVLVVTHESVKMCKIAPDHLKQVELTS